MLSRNPERDKAIIIEMAESNTLSLKSIENSDLPRKHGLTPQRLQQIWDNRGKYENLDWQSSNGPQEQFNGLVQHITKPATLHVVSVNLAGEGYSEADAKEKLAQLLHNALTDLGY